MRTFVQQAKATQQHTSVEPTGPARAHVGQSPAVSANLYLQRTLGNQAVQRLLQAQLDGLVPGSEPQHPADTARFVSHRYCNQAILRMWATGTPWPSLEPMGPSQSAGLQRKCYCGGACAECRQKQVEGAAPPAFFGDVEDGIPKLMPEAEPTIPQPEPMDKTASCKGICDRAYATSSMNQDGGGVICDGATKCPCVFDGIFTRRGQCPDFDRIVLRHEESHLQEVDCDPKKELHRPPPRNRSFSECEHYKLTIPDLKAAIPKARGDCEKEMKKHLNFITVFVRDNCDKK
jgi:hypothetical protein